MRRLCAVGLGVALLAGSASIAPAQIAGGINYFELFQQLDANGDRIVDRGEVAESGQAAFDQLVQNADSNKDGRIDIEEYQQMIGSLREAFGSRAGGLPRSTRMATARSARTSTPAPSFSSGGRTRTATASSPRTRPTTCSPARGPALARRQRHSPSGSARWTRTATAR